MKKEPQNIVSEEWDFSYLEKETKEYQSTALAWELNRERFREGLYEPIAKLLGIPKSDIPIPWSSLDITAQKAYLNQKTPDSDKANVREISPTDYLRFQLEFHGQNETPLTNLAPNSNHPIKHGESVYCIAIDWSKHKAEDVYRDLLKNAQKWRKETQKEKRIREDKPMGKLWDLACYRLKKKSDATNNEVCQMLNALPEFKKHRSAFSAEAVPTCVSDTRDLLDLLKRMNFSTDRNHKQGAYE